MKSIKSWEVIQQYDGFANIDTICECDEWIKNPKTDEEIRISNMFINMGTKVIEENTGIEITSAIKGKMIDKYRCLIHIEHVPVGGPYTLERITYFNDKESNNEFFWNIGAIARHVGVGDVYFVAGQSNAAGWGKGIFTEESEIGVSILRENEEWDLMSSDNSHHNPFLTLGKFMHKRLGYPIGFIQRAVGGSPISAWKKGGNLIEKFKKEAYEKEFDIKAVIWYQGCTEACENNYENYFNDFFEFVNETRKTFNKVELPVFTFQLNKFWEENKADVANEGYDNIREIQRTIPKKIKNTYVIPTIDAYKMSDEIHNGKIANMMLGERLGYLMLETLYHKLTFYKAPDISKAVKTANNTVELIFENVVDDFQVYGATPSNLPIQINDEEGIVLIDSFSLNKNVITLKLKRELLKDAKIKGNYGKCPHRIIIDAVSQLPVLSFCNVKIN